METVVWRERGWTERKRISWGFEKRTGQTHYSYMLSLDEKNFFSLLHLSLSFIFLSLSLSFWKRIENWRRTNFRRYKIGKEERILFLLPFLVSFENKIRWSEWRKKENECDRQIQREREREREMKGKERERKEKNFCINIGTKKATWMDGWNTINKSVQKWCFFFFLLQSDGPRYLQGHFFLLSPSLSISNSLFLPLLHSHTYREKEKRERRKKEREREGRKREPESYASSILGKSCPNGIFIQNTFIPNISQVHLAKISSSLPKWLVHPFHSSSSPLFHNLWLQHLKSTFECY